MNGGRFISWWHAGLLRDQMNRERELALERVRKQDFPERISRLHGMYCFLEKTSADRAVAWGWHFRPKNLAELSLVEATGQDQLLDANWITYFDPRANNPDDEWMHQYWRGEPHPNAEPVWEVLVEGKVIILGTGLRERAYKAVESHWPDSLPLLEMSRLGACIGSNIGTINVFMSDSDQCHEVKFMMDERDVENPGFRAKLKKLVESGHSVNRAALAAYYEQDRSVRSPDMTRFQFRFLRQSHLS